MANFNELPLKNVFTVSQMLLDGIHIEQISSQLGISRDAVNALLVRAKQVVSLNYSFKRETKLEVQLVATFGLAQALVVESGLERHARRVLGQAAAEYFRESVRQDDRVALSCGETLLEMLLALPQVSDIPLKISQLSIEADPETVHQAPATLAGLLRAKSAPESEVYGIHLPAPRIATACQSFRQEFREGPVLKRLREQAMQSRYVFVGVGAPRQETASVGRSFLKMAEAACPGHFAAYVAKLGLVGEINNQVYDRNGRNRTEEIPGFSDFVINILTLDDLRTLAADRQRVRVIAVATGKTKTEALNVAARTGIINSLITTVDDAVRMLSNHAA